MQTMVGRIRVFGGAVVFAGLSVILRFAGYEQQAHLPRMGNIPILLQVSNGINAPASLVTAVALDLARTIGRGVYLGPGIDLVIFFVSSVTSWLWLATWFLRPRNLDYRSTWSNRCSAAAALVIGASLLYVTLGPPLSAGMVLPPGRKFLTVAWLCWGGGLVVLAIILWQRMASRNT
jgi:hypothetical protein